MYVTSDNVNIRVQPNTKSKIVDQVGFNYEISVSKTEDDSWLYILHKGKIRYINSKYVSNKKLSYKEFDVPYAKNKTWMPYTAITSKTSKQYKLQLMATTGKYGIRMVDDRYCVALGSHFGCEIGQYFDLVLANGAVIPCIMSDQKSNKHTDSANIITVDTNCLSEFIVDRHSLKYEAKRDGDISSCCEEWNSPVVQIKIYKKVVKV